MKNLSVLPKIVLITVTTSLIYGCNKDKVDINYEIKGDWKVISFVDYKNSTIVTKTNDNTWPQFNNGDITVNFIPSDETSGIVSGRNVTNTFSSNYTIDHQGGITISGGIWTEINEPEWGRLFHSITNAESYAFRNEYLVIFYNQRKNSITLERVDE